MGQPKKENPEKLATQGTQDVEKQHKNTTQPRETGNIGYTRQNKYQSKQKEQHRDTDNIGYTRHRTK